MRGKFGAERIPFVGSQAGLILRAERCNLGAKFRHRIRPRRIDAAFQRQRFATFDPSQRQRGKSLGRCGKILPRQGFIFGQGRIERYGSPHVESGQPTTGEIVVDLIFDRFECAHRHFGLFAKWQEIRGIAVTLMPPIGIGLRLAEKLLDLLLG